MGRSGEMKYNSFTLTVAQKVRSTESNLRKREVDFRRAVLRTFGRVPSVPEVPIISFYNR